MKEQDRPRAPRSVRVRLADPLFARFWRLYPKRQKRLEAETAWRRLEVDEVLAGRMFKSLAWQVQQPGWQEQGGKFIPLPASWLTQGRWEDEPFHTPPRATSADGPAAEPDLVGELCEAAGIKRFETRWFTGCTLTRDRSDTLVLIVPDDDARTHITKHYAEQLAAAARVRGARLLITAPRRAEPRSMA